GHSGVRAVVAELLCEMINRGVHPVIPSKGSVGASGDLAPLAHLALVVMGEGEAFVDGKRLPGDRALAQVGLTPVPFEAKEGISLVNGTQCMTALGALALIDAEDAARLADLVGAMSLEALKGTPRAFDARIHAVRPHPGQAASARNLSRLLADSAIVASHKNCGKVQDAYEMISGGNFHGQPVAIALDFAGIAAAELANIAERRIEQMVNPHLSSGLPAFLSPESGLNSGYMMAQVTAAALVSENKILAHPASVDSIPSSAGREDHVSMGVHAADKLARIVDNVRNVLALELLCAAQGVDLRAPHRPGPALDATHAAVRTRVAPLGTDRVVHRDVDSVRSLIDDGTLVAAARRHIELE